MKADLEICPYPQRNILRVNLENTGASLCWSLFYSEWYHFACSSSCKVKLSTKYPWLTSYLCKNENGPQFLCLCPSTQSRTVMSTCLEGNKFVLDQCRACLPLPFHADMLQGQKKKEKKPFLHLSQFPFPSFITSSTTRTVLERGMGSLILPYLAPRLFKVNLTAEGIDAYFFKPWYFFAMTWRQRSNFTLFSFCLENNANCGCRYVWNSLLLQCDVH